jgi:hypothetical protein
MDQNTTNRAAKRGRLCGISQGGRSLVAACLLGLLLGCTTAQQRESPTNLVGTLRFRDAGAVEAFQSTHRAGNLYQDFRPVMVVDAVPMDLRYRQLYLAMLKDRYLLPDAELAPLQAESDKEFDNRVELVVLVYGGSNVPVPLEKATSRWRVLLKDDDGQVLTPAKIEKVKEDSPIYQYVNLYFYGLDRWSQLYRISFPKLEKSLVGKAIGPDPMQLLVTGIGGTVVLSWRDTSIFYRPAPRAAARP